MDFDLFLLVCNYIGTIAFAASGAIKGFDKHLDIFGISLLAIVTAVGGGILRDSIISRFPSALFDPSSIYLAIFVAIIILLYFVGIMRQNSKIGKNKQKMEIVNVSYDPTRELYERYNGLFKAYYKEKYGKDVNIIQSHGGSGSQARSVIEGLDADVVTLALENDVALLEKVDLLEKGWIDKFPGSSSPYTSTIVFLVRKGNPQNIKDWNDLAKKGVKVITPDPKSSGGACWNFLAAWSYGREKFGNDENKIQNFVKNIYDNVTVMDSGARAATTTFVENNQGDVLIAWENEAIATVKEYPDKYQIVYPSVSILAQPTVAVVDKIAKNDGTYQISTEYLKYLYSEKAQEIIAESGYRPYDQKVLKKYGNKLDLKMKLTKIDNFGGWKKAYEKFFNEGALFDKIYEN